LINTKGQNKQIRKDKLIITLLSELFLLKIFKDL